MGITTGNSEKKTLNDHELVKLAIENGNQGAYAELMQRYRDTVFFLLMKKTNDQTEAEDLTIEVFGKAFLNLRKYSSEYAFSTWLNSIASNHYIDFIRKKKEAMLSIDHHDHDSVDISLSFKCNNPDPEEHFIKKEQVVMLQQVVEKLKPHYRTLIELRYYKDHSIEEIAEKLELPVGTVKAKLFRARDFLHNILMSSRRSM